ncbi:DNA-binding response regulator [Chryseotalea sanaruensis]|uniref:DNA-binding response regulator n=1 Tax=Chryseotalea sanaruensis TaxID=2482724 RepID=A0A401U5A3_9BACT|nr:response regulator [Chryseotalea sanaruensis]GCC50108.1 DNA-binding response regulator [Chryseotalea sanaruensis]
MENIKVLIVEDQSLIAASIASTLKQHALEVVAISDSGEEAIEKVGEVKPDLILMDIELSGALDGIATAKFIQDKYDIPIIYLSDYTDQKTVDRAKKTMPANYLSKPFMALDLIRAIEIAFHNANQATKSETNQILKDRIFLRVDNQSFIKLDYDDILYLEADRAYCCVVTTQKTYKLANNMKHIHEQLNNHQFAKVHRSFIVNVNKITSLEGNTLHLDSHEVQMSMEFKEDLLERLKLVR